MVTEDLQVEDCQQAVGLELLSNAVLLNKRLEGFLDISYKYDWNFPVQRVLEVPMTKIDLVAEKRGFRKRSFQKFHGDVADKWDKLRGQDEEDLFLVDELVEQTLPWLLVLWSVYYFGVIDGIFEMQGNNVASRRTLHSYKGIVRKLLLIHNDMSPFILQVLQCA